MLSRINPISRYDTYFFNLRSNNFLLINAQLTKKLSSFIYRHLGPVAMRFKMY